MEECPTAAETQTHADSDLPTMPRRLCYLVLALVALGVALRVRAYVHNPALWFDEAAFANDLARYPLTLGEGAVGRMSFYPFGFLALTKLSVSVFGDGEYAMRLVPFLASLAALALFYVLARRCLKPNAAAIAVCLFAVNPRLIYHAVEAKPFSSDVAVVTGLAYLAVRALAAPLTLGMVLLLAASGAAAVWVSYSSVFCLAGFGTVMGISALARRQWGRAARLCAVGLAWALSFGSYYCLGLHNVSRSGELLSYWQRDFLPLPPKSWSDIDRVGRKVVGIFHDPAGLKLPALAALIFCVGFLSLSRRSRPKAFAFAAPIAIVWFAAALRIYPLDDRVVLFSVPLLHVLLAEGVERVRSALAGKARWAGVLFLLAVLAPPCAGAMRRAIVPRQYEEIRPVLAYVAANRKAGDTLYVSNAALPAVRYYAHRYGLDEMDTVWGRTSPRKPDKCAAELDTLRGRGRMWFVFAHARQSERDVFLHHLDGIGSRLREVSAARAWGYLYDLSQRSEPSPSRPEPPDSDRGKGPTVESP
jgi:hypothetical protein